MVKAPFLQADDYFNVTPSDSLDLKDDPNNPKPGEYTIAALQINDNAVVDVSIVSPHDADASRPETIKVSGPREIPFVCKRVRATGTTATNIIAIVKKL